jgi:hypothetical protein
LTSGLSMKSGKISSRESICCTPDWRGRGLTTQGSGVRGRSARLSSEKACATRSPAADCQGAGGTRSTSAART